MNRRDAIRRLAAAVVAPSAIAAAAPAIASPAAAVADEGLVTIAYMSARDRAMLRYWEEVYPKLLEDMKRLYHSQLFMEFGSNEQCVGLEAFISTPSDGYGECPKSH